MLRGPFIFPDYTQTPLEFAPDTSHYHHAISELAPLRGLLTPICFEDFHMSNATLIRDLGKVSSETNGTPPVPGEAGGQPNFG